MLHGFDFTVGQLKSLHHIKKLPAITFNSDCYGRLGTAAGLGFQDENPAQISPSARHEMHCGVETISAGLLDDDRTYRLREFSARRFDLCWWIWIRQYAQDFGVVVDGLQR